MDTTAATLTVEGSGSTADLPVLAWGAQRVITVPYLIGAVTVRDGTKEVLRAQVTHGVAGAPGQATLEFVAMLEQLVATPPPPPDDLGAAARRAFALAHLESYLPLLRATLEAARDGGSAPAGMPAITSDQLRILDELIQGSKELVAPSAVASGVVVGGARRAIQIDSALGILAVASSS